MSFKVLLLVIVIALTGTFIYFKVQASGDPTSGFNQTTRYALGRHSWVRTVLGLHNDGDAKAEYLLGKGPISIEYFKPQLEDIDADVLNKFAEKVGEYTGRETSVVLGGSLDYSSLDIKNLSGLKIQEFFQKPTGGSTIFVFFAEDYRPRQESELSTTYQESGIFVSLVAHRQFLQNYSNDLDKYLLSSLLHEFGHQIGLEHNSDPSCIMDAHVGSDGKPLEIYTSSSPSDFCPAEKDQINAMRLRLQNN